MHYLLFYEVAEDYVSKLASFRNQRLEKAWKASERGELLLGGALAHLFLVARLNGQVIGTVMAGFDGVRGWIHHLAVHGSYRRQGIASSLMRAAEKELEAVGCPKVNLQVIATKLRKFTAF